MAVVAVVLGLNEMLFALAPQGGRPTEATCAFAGALVNVLGVNVLGFGVWTLIYAAPRWDALVLGPARGAPIPIAPKMARPVWRSLPVHAQYGAPFPITPALVVLLYTQATGCSSASTRSPFGRRCAGWAPCQWRYPRGRSRHSPSSCRTTYSATPPATTRISSVATRTCA